VIRGKRRDNNEGPIVQALRSAGAFVQPLGEAGVPDLLVGFRGETFLIEVKNPDAKGGGKYNTGDGALTSAQSKWWAQWLGAQPVVVTTVMEALRAIGVELS
jgi:hypothetical protein